MNLAPDHADFLKAHAVNLELAELLGVRSVAAVADLPEAAMQGLGRHLPGILLPWTSPDGRISYQLRPDTAPMKPDGEEIKYLFQRGQEPVLWAVRHHPLATKILLVEGSKQCLAAAQYAPPEFAVYGIAGCWGWRHDGAAINDLKVAKGKEVYCLFDADAEKNLQVYTAAEELARALTLIHGAKDEIKWVTLPAGGTAGLDDVLAKVDEADRGGVLARMIAAATNKIAKRKPVAKRKPKRTVVLDPSRPMVYVDDEALAVADTITKHLKDRWDGRELFCHGGVLSLLVDGAMRPLNRDTFNDLVMRTVVTVIDVGGNPRPQPPGPYVMTAVLGARAHEFTALDRVATVPFVRHDGSICIEPGYDAAMQTYLLPSDDLEKVEVPDNPTPGKVREAVDLLLTEWLGDMPFRCDASRANALGLVLTYFIRGRVPVVPLAVVTGLQMSVGKNLLADCISIVALGRPLIPKGFNDNDEENRKATLAAFRAGEPAVCWDEAHRLHGANLARLLTSEIYADRILGVSNEAQFPNRMVWTALGNQVKLIGDIGRRVYPIDLRPTCPNPENRSTENYRHPDLPEWTRDHRAELVSACLVLIRAWHDAGEPRVRADFGSFEKWQGLVGGILRHAEVPEFLANRDAWRRANNYEDQHWSEHMQWLVDRFGQEISFECRDIKSMAQANLAEYAAPPNLEDTTGAGYTRELGKAYARRIEVWCGGYQLVQVGVGSTGAVKWRVVGHDQGDPPPEDVSSVPDVPDAPDVPDVPSPTDVTDNTDAPQPLQVRESALETHALKHISGGGNASAIAVTPRARAQGVVFDLETASAAELYTRGNDFVRLGGWASTDGSAPETTTDFPALVSQLHAAPAIIGHNILNFDLPALAKRHGLNLQAVADRAWDTLLMARYLDPPEARQHGIDFSRRYDLDSLAKKYIGPEAAKSGDLKALAKTYGDFDAIPFDLTDRDEQRRIDAGLYHEYLRQDVRLTGDLYRALWGELTDPENKHRLPDNAMSYIRREHQVAAIATQISLNGFRVDQGFVDAQLTKNAATRATCQEILRDTYDIPPFDDAMTPLKKAPLATKLGKAALIRALEERGATGWLTTDATHGIATSREAMEYLRDRYIDDAKWDRKTPIRPGFNKPTPTNRAAEIVMICGLIATVVSLRTVYETVNKHLVEIDDGWRVHPTVSMKQSTGRWSLSKPGLTVMGKRGGKYTERNMFTADPGERIIAVDLSQVDMRAVAGLSGDRAYIDMLAHEDPHAEIARLLFGDPALREVAKPVGHGWNYGRGIKAISISNDIDSELVKQFDREMREKFPRLVEWQDEVRAIAKDGDLLNNGFGRRMRPEPSRSHTQGPALMGQGAARDIMMEGLLRLAERHPECLSMLRAQVHDEIVLSVPAADAVDIQRAVIEAMEFEWTGPGGVPVPIRAEGGPTNRTSWGQVYAKDAA